MQKKLPQYLLEKSQMTGSVTFSVLFAIVFLNLYTPFSSTAWFDLSRADYFAYTIIFIAAGTVIMALSRVLMYHTRKWGTLRVWQYVLWLLLEIACIALFYTFYTCRYIPSVSESFVEVFPKAALYTFLILIIPYSLITLYSALNDRNQTLRLLKASQTTPEGMPLAEADGARKQPENESDVIYLADNNGNLRLSVKLDTLYYIEAQDNYIRVYYLSKGKLTSYMLRCKLKTVAENCAGSSLVRCHRSFMVNIKKIKVLRREKDGVFIDMDCEGINPIPVSRSYSDFVFRYFR